MHRYFAVAILLSLAFGGISVVHAATSDDQAFFNKHIGELVKVEPTRVQGAAVEKVFTAPVYLVKIDVHGGGETLQAARVGDALVDVSLPNTDQAMPRLTKLISPSFKILEQKDAAVFQGALDGLYPIDSDSADDLKARTIKHSGTTWNFVRGKFFDHFSGFVVTTDAAGQITNIAYSLKIQ